MKGFEMPTAQQEDQEKQESMQLYIDLPAQERTLREDNVITDHTYIIMLGEKIREKLDLPESINLPEGEFKIKNEFHVTALGFDTAKDIMERSQAENGPEFRAEVNKALSEIDFSFNLNIDSLKVIHNLQYDPHAVIRQKENPKNPPEQGAFESEYTVVVDVDMPGMDLFYARMRDLGVELGSPATHVTLYIKQQRLNPHATGLGINMRDMQAQLQGEKFPKISMREITTEELGIEING